MNTEQSAGIITAAKKVLDNPPDGVDLAPVKQALDLIAEIRTVPPTPSLENEPRPVTRKRALELVKILEAHTAAQQPAAIAARNEVVDLIVDGMRAWFVQHRDEIIAGWKPAFDAHAAAFAKATAGRTAHELALVDPNSNDPAALAAAGMTQYARLRQRFVTDFGGQIGSGNLERATRYATLDDRADVNTVAGHSHGKNLPGWYALANTRGVTRIEWQTPDQQRATQARIAGRPAPAPVLSPETQLHNRRAQADLDGLELIIDKADDEEVKA